MNTYKIFTFGCFSNQNDSKKIMTVLEKIGYSEAVKQPASLYVFNACSVQQLVTNKVFNKIRETKKKHTDIVIAVTGCVLKEDLPNFEKLIDFFFHIKELEDLPRILSDLSRQTLKNKIYNHNRTDCDYLEIKTKNKSFISVNIPVMDGCDNFCTYCAVPYTRGREVSRTMGNVLEEIKFYAEQGTKEIVLLGTNVNSYNPSDINIKSNSNPYTNPLAVLLWEINQIPQIAKIRYSSPHPRNMSDETIDAFKLNKVAKHIHLPLQAGDDEILKKMNRKYTKDWYLNIIKKIKKARPGITLTTDIIIGFPGETKKQFDNTIAVYKKVKFDLAYTPIYSERNGTLASKIYKNDIPSKEKKERQKFLENLMYQIAEKNSKKYLNKTLKVLVDTYDHSYLGGNSHEMKRVKFKGEKKLIGQIIKVRINKVEAFELKGKMIN
jgi:tRNA-2-methylthio-N6-dimethylallyladenosine synthase